MCLYNTLAGRTGQKLHSDAITAAAHLCSPKIYQPVDKLESCGALPSQLTPKKLSGKQASMRPQTSALLAATAAAAAWLLYKKKRKRRVVITGCCGNLGRKLGAYLQERGVEVVGIEHPDYCAKGSEPPCDCVVQGLSLIHI